MNKLLLLMLIGLFLIYSNLLAQNYVVEFEKTGFSVNFPDMNDIDQVRGLDLEGDGILEIVMEKDNSDSILVYDGASYMLKWSHPTFGSPYYFRGFYDIDADNNREAVFDSKSGVAIRIVDTQTNMVEFSLDGDYSIETILDFDNDSYHEMIIYDWSNNIVQVWGDGTPNNIATNSGSLPTPYKLSQNYPNPFNPSTTIEYSVQKAEKVQIEIFNTLGQSVRTLVNESKSIGEYSITWDGKDDNGKRLATGTYFYQLRVGDFTSTKKMLFLK